MTFPFRLNEGRVIPLQGMEYLAPLLAAATTAKNEAEDWAEAAQAAATSVGNVFSSTAAGLTAVAEGGTFWVSSSDGLALYRDVAGSAVLLYTQFQALVYDPIDPNLDGSMAVGNGLRSLTHASGDQGQNNQTFGKDAGLVLGTGRLNLLIGRDVGKAMTDLSVVNTYGGVNGNAGNVFVGHYAASVANGAYDNTGIGVQVMLNLTTGMDNFAGGINALKNIEGGSENVALGHGVFEYGVGAGSDDDIDETTQTPGAGYSWFHRMTGVGDQAGRFLNDGTTQKTRGKKSVYVGAQTRSADNWAINENVFGYGALGEGSNTAVYGNTDITGHYFPGGSIYLEDHDTTAPAPNAHIDASTGQVRRSTFDFGQTVSSVVASGSAVSLTTGDPVDVTSISVPAGTWDISGQLGFTGGGTTTVTYLRGGANTVSAGVPTSTDMVAQHGLGSALFGVADVNLPIPTIRRTFAETTTVYLIAQAYFGTSTAAAFGAIRATRVV